MHFGDLTATAIEANHDLAESAYGYRFDYHGRSVVSGNTNFHPPLAAAAQGADVLVKEAQSQPLVQLIERAAANVGDTRIAQTMNDIQRYHTDPLEASQIANEARVKLLVFTHLELPFETVAGLDVLSRGKQKPRRDLDERKRRNTHRFAERSDKSHCRDDSSVVNEAFLVGPHREDIDC